MAGAGAHAGCAAAPPAQRPWATHWRSRQQLSQAEVRRHLTPRIMLRRILTVTGGSKKILSVSARPRHSSVRNSVLALSSSTPARSFGASRWLVAYSCGPKSAPLRCRPAEGGRSRCKRWVAPRRGEAEAGRAREGVWLSLPAFPMSFRLPDCKGERVRHEKQETGGFSLFSHPRAGLGRPESASARGCPLHRPLR